MVVRGDIDAAYLSRDRPWAATAAVVATPANSWGERERQATKGLQMIAAFPRRHVNIEAARVIAREISATRAIYAAVNSTHAPTTAEHRVDEWLTTSAKP